MSSSTAGEIEGSCEKCGHPYAMPHRPIEAPAGGGPGTSEVPNGAKSQAKYNSKPLAGSSSISTKLGTEKGSAAINMPDDQDVKHPAIAGSGGGSSKRGAKTATEKPEDEIWQPSATWEMTAQDEDRADEDY